MKRSARSSIRAKLVLDVALNSPHIESRVSDGSSGSMHRTSVSINAWRIRPIGQQKASAPPPHDGFDGSIIDLDAIEDEVQMLSSSSGLPQARNLSRRNRPVTIIRDEDLDTNSRISKGPLILSFNDHHTHKRRSNTKVINCELYSGVKEEYNVKGKNVMECTPVPPKELAFTCPVCLNTLVEASSTICGHIFCQSCIKASIKAQKRCPTCRKKLTMNNFHRVYLPTT